MKFDFFIILLVAVAITSCHQGSKTQFDFIEPSQSNIHFSIYCSTNIFITAAESA